MQKIITSTYGSNISDIVSNSISSTVNSHHEVDDAAVQQAVEEVAAVAHQQDVIRIAHVMTHDISHGEPVSIAENFSLQRWKEVEDRKGFVERRWFRARNRNSTVRFGKIWAKNEKFCKKTEGKLKYLSMNISFGLGFCSCHSSARESLQIHTFL